MSLPLQSLKTFEARNMFFAEDKWAAALGSLERIENLVITHTQSYLRLLDALWELTRPDDMHPLPMLRRLVVRKCELVPDEPCMDSLTEFLLDWRERSGEPLQELYLRNCSTTEAAIANLRTLVGKVNWDGHRGR
ncbi:hypothetical protein D9615_009821 [Tricholomella constricta]|uniref:Uncharacterized protein n=1 Tax=Tricholomella constricta TaxID=117010 RepID=A0A8H5GU17_9AGAR|nr:hypothetical protein D9615_009821 [Tricholomella constricta]